MKARERAAEASPDGFHEVRPTAHVGPAHRPPTWLLGLTCWAALWSGACEDQARTPGSSISTLDAPPSLQVYTSLDAIRAGRGEEGATILVRALGQLDLSQLDANSQQVAQEAVALLLEAGQGEAAAQLLERGAQSGDVGWALLHLWLLDARDDTVAAWAMRDRELRTLQAGGAGEGSGEGDWSCRLAERFYLARLARAQGGAHRLDALAHAWDACHSDGMAQEAVERLAAMAAEAEGSGDPGTAITYFDILAGQSWSGLTVPEDVATEARAALHRLLWPPFRERRRNRFMHHSAEDWTESGQYLADRDVVHVTVEVASDDASTVGNPSAAVRGAADQAAGEALFLAALEVAEIHRSFVNLPPYLGGFTLSLVRIENGRAFFDAEIPFEDVLRFIYESQGENGWGPDDDAVPPAPDQVGP